MVQSFYAVYVDFLPMFSAMLKATWFVPGFIFRKPLSKCMGVLSTGCHVLQLFQVSLIEEVGF